MSTDNVPIWISFYGALACIAEYSSFSKPEEHLYNAVISEKVTLRGIPYNGTAPRIVKLKDMQQCDKKFFGSRLYNKKVARWDTSAAFTDLEVRADQLTDYMQEMYPKNKATQNKKKSTAMPSDGEVAKAIKGISSPKPTLNEDIKNKLSAAAMPLIEALIIETPAYGFPQKGRIAQALHGLPQFRSWMPGTIERNIRQDALKKAFAKWKKQK